MRVEGHATGQFPLRRVPRATQGGVALNAAAQAGDLTGIQALLDAGVHIDARDKVR